MEKITVTKLIEEIREEMCKHYCKYNEQCEEALENNDLDSIVCPLDRL
ncbi:MAG: hypothetical protein IKU44_04420 [Firmicutes bacterium]|nr:hypothetical protein [Bacillota bacterium]